MKSSLATRTVLRLASLATALTLLSGCNTFAQKPDDGAGIGYWDERYQSMANLKAYTSCRDEALQIDEQARSNGSVALYLSSAELLEKCEAGVGPGAREIDSDERMRAYALSIINYLKAGEIDRARRNFEAFNDTFPGMDLFFNDGTSYKDTVKALLGQVKSSDYSHHSSLNTNAELKAEMRRINYWKNK